MYIKATLTNEIRLLVNGKMDRGEVVAPNWITHELCQQHLGEHSKNDSFATYCIVSFVRDLVGKYCKNKKREDIKADNQLAFDGELFDVPKYTDVRRGGEVIFVPTLEMTARELEAKANQLHLESESKSALARAYAALALRLRSSKTTARWE